MTIAFIFAFAGLGLALYRHFFLFRSGIRHDKFNEATRKLLAAGNRDRAEKLAHAIPNHPYLAVVRGLIERSKQLGPADGAGMVTESLREQLDAGADKQEKRMRGKNWLSLLASAAAVGAIASGTAYGASAMPTIAIPAATAALTLVSWMSLTKQLRAHRTYGAELVDALTDYVLHQRG